MTMLTLNAGSSSLRVAVFVGDDMQRIAACHHHSDPPNTMLQEFLCTPGIPPVQAVAHRIVHGGGVGEHAAIVRAKILAGLEPLGIVLDTTANQAAVGVEGKISDRGSRVEIWVIPVDEAALLARAARAVVSQSEGAPA